MSAVVSSPLTAPPATPSAIVPLAAASFAAVFLK